MGGTSESSIRLTDNRAIFTGNVSTANSGGFASVRTQTSISLKIAGFQPAPTARQRRRQALQIDCSQRS